MRLPVPRNRLVLLTLLGALVSAGAALALAVPGLLATEDSAALAESSYTQPGDDDAASDGGLLDSAAPAGAAPAPSAGETPPAASSAAPPPALGTPEPADGAIAEDAPGETPQTTDEEPPLDESAWSEDEAPVQDDVPMSERDYEMMKKQWEWERELAKHAHEDEEDDD